MTTFSPVNFALFAAVSAAFSGRASVYLGAVQTANESNKLKILPRKTPKTQNAYENISVAIAGQDRARNFGVKSENFKNLNNVRGLKPAEARESGAAREKLDFFYGSWFFNDKNSARYVKTTPDRGLLSQNLDKEAKFSRDEASVKFTSGKR